MQGRKPLGLSMKVFEEETLLFRSDTAVAFLLISLFHEPFRGAATAVSIL